MKKLIIQDLGEGISPRYQVERVEEVPGDFILIPSLPVLPFSQIEEFIPHIISYHLQLNQPTPIDSLPSGIFLHISQGDWNYQIQLEQAYLYDLIPASQRKFKIGDLVECVLINLEEVHSDNSNFSSGNGWSPGLKFVVQKNVRGDTSGRQMLYSSQFLGAIYAEWVRLIKPALINPPKIEIPDKFTIGSDIEVSFVRDGRQVNKYEALKEDWQNTSTFGDDHMGRVGEFRPEFAWDPRKHCANLKGAIRQIIEGENLVEGARLDASHILGNDVVGGHIHFGIKDPHLIEKCRKNLDYWLLPTVQPLFPKNTFLKRAGGCGYGRLENGDSSVREQNHGFEYRLVPSFIFDENISRGIFCLAYAIVKLTIEGKLKVRMDEMDSNWINKFIKNYNSYGIGKMNDLREESIKKLLDKNLLKGLYNDILPLFHAIRNEDKFSGDLAEGWKMNYKYVLNSGNKKEEIIWSDRAIRTAEQLRSYIRNTDNTV